MAHIAMLIPNLRGGGAERITLRIADGLVNLGHNIMVSVGLHAGTRLD